MTDRTEVKRITQLERMPSSRNGNPRFRVTFSDGTSAPTQPDAGWAYGAENRENMRRPVTVHFNGRGHVTYAAPLPAWTPAELEGKRFDTPRMARQVLDSHGHGPTSDKLTRENCGACVLHGYGADHDGPNYAGWARLYVQASRPVPAEWRDAFTRELETPDNDAYAVALARDVATYGVTFTDGRRL